MEQQLRWFVGLCSWRYATSSSDSDRGIEAHARTTACETRSLADRIGRGSPDVAGFFLPQYPEFVVSLLQRMKAWTKDEQGQKAESTGANGRNPEGHSTVPELSQEVSAYEHPSLWIGSLFPARASTLPPTPMPLHWARCPHRAPTTPQSSPCHTER